MLVPFDFGKVWKAWDNRTLEKVLERNPMSRINVGHLVLELSGSERVWVAGWCLMVSGPCSGVTVVICCLFSSLGGQHLPQVLCCKLGLLERGAEHPTVVKFPWENTSGGNWGFVVEGGQELLHNLEVSKIQTKRAVRTLFPVRAGCNFYTKLCDSRRAIFLMRSSLFLQCYPQYFWGLFLLLWLKLYWIFI